FSVTAAERPVADPLPKRVRDIFAIPAERRTPAQTDAVFAAWRATVPEWKEANDRIEELWKQHPVGASQLTTMAREVPRTTFLLKRGDFLRPDHAVKPGVRAVLHALPADAPPNRLGLAKWLTAREAPTTARAFVNRVWQAYFGTGLVAS